MFLELDVLELMAGTTESKLARRAAKVSICANLMNRFFLYSNACRNFKWNISVWMAEDNGAFGGSRQRKRSNEECLL